VWETFEKLCQLQILFFTEDGNDSLLGDIVMGVQAELTIAAYIALTDLRPTLLGVPLLIRLIPFVVILLANGLFVSMPEQRHRASIALYGTLYVLAFGATYGFHAGFGSTLFLVLILPWLVVVALQTALVCALPRRCSTYLPILVTGFTLLIIVAFLYLIIKALLHF
jgi:hypothetical protein